MPVDEPRVEMDTRTAPDRMASGCQRAGACCSAPWPPSDGEEPAEFAQQQQQATRVMARQQLTVSDDSPFNDSNGRHQDCVAKTKSLQAETDEIKRHLDLVRSRLSDFSLAKETAPSTDKQHQAAPAMKSAASNTGKGDERKYEYDQRVTSSDSQFHRDNQPTARARARNVGEPIGPANVEQTKLRPLTGQADCPNCACDRRRQSVCDNCLSFRQSVVQAKTEDCARQPTFITGVESEQADSKGVQADPLAAKAAQNYEDRPIRPSKQASSGTSNDVSKSDQATTVDRGLVPNQLFTISKSLNDKRAQLARAIEDLQAIMDRVKKREERLEQERKVAQLYKEQWRFGPTIGGGAGGPNQPGGQGGQPRGRTCYKSRFDPQLARDSNSLMGFRHIEPAMKLRQHHGSNSSLNARPQTGATRAPQPRPRRSKLGSTRMPDAAHQDAVSNRLACSKQTAARLPQSHHARSKSLESLNQIERLVVTARPLNVAGTTKVANGRGQLAEGANFGEGKASSELDLASGSPGPEEAVEEVLEEEFQSNEGEPARQQISDRTKAGEETPAGGKRDESGGTDGDPHGARAKKTSWVPVFGETEIKTVDRRQPTRKTLVLGRDAPVRSSQRPAGSILRPQQAGLSRASALKQRSHSAHALRLQNGYSPVMSEATKKLQFASDLLEGERRDSRTRNQLIVSNKFRPLSAARSRQQSETHSAFKAPPPPPPSGRSARGARPSPASEDARELVSSANREINRLELMIGEQQRILAQLTARANSCCCGQRRARESSASSSRQTKSKILAGQAGLMGAQIDPCAAPPLAANGQLVAHLRERLNKTKARLARTLEEERAKHQQLERQVHSSLRRQSDLRAENELLRQSLSKCIDTCLRDISSTFESLSATLADSVASFGPGDGLAARPGQEDEEELANVAQLIEDNRHLRQMQGHIETIENQRRSLFEELSSEKLRSKQLELELIQSKLEHDQLVEAKRKLERQMGAASDGSRSPKSAPPPASTQDAPQPSTSNQVETNTSSMADALEVPQQQSQADLSDKTTSDSDELFTTTGSTTFDSIDVYRKYIQSMTPDFGAIRHERRMILDEFESIKKMLANMND